MRKKNENMKRLLQGISIILFIVLIVQILPKGDNLFSVSGLPTTDGNIYYEERCIDVSDYKAEGYTLDSVDENGCEIVRKELQITTTSGGYNTVACPKAGSSNSRSSSVRATVCGAFGKDWRFAGCDSHCVSGSRSKSCLLCGLYQYDYKGGTEKVVNTCNYDSNDLLASETFSSGTISIFSTRYPVKDFCLAHPSIITDDSSLTSQTTNEIYKSLKNGETFTIPSGQTLTMFYIIENNFNLPTVCDSSNNLAINVESGVCDSTLGFTYLCSEGVFDALTGSCVVQPEISEICERGRYDVNSGLCVYNPPIQVDCGRNDAYYSIEDNVCNIVPELNYACDSGYNFTQPLSAFECSQAGGVWDKCPQCPEGRVCPDFVCEATCSKGQTCYLEIDREELCINGEIRSDGTCDILGETISFCPSDTTLIDGGCFTDSGFLKCPDGFESEDNKCYEFYGEIFVCPENDVWNSKTKRCENDPTALLLCEDGSTPYLDGFTPKCKFVPETYIDCADNLIYNAELNKCVPEIAVYDPNFPDNLFIYKEIRLGCESDSECIALDEELACSKDSGICYATSIEKFKEREQELLDEISFLEGDISELAKRIGDLNLDLDRMSLIVDELELSITEKALLIQSLTDDLEKQQYIISQLKLSIQEQAEIISEMDYTIKEQAKTIDRLDLTLQEQADTILALDLSVQEQAELIQELTQKTDEQAILISNLELNVEEQAELINELTDLTERQAEIINNLDLNVKEQAELIQELTRTTESQRGTISELELNVQRQAELIGFLTDNVEEQANIIENLELNINQQAELIQELTQKTDEQAILIVSLTNNVEEQANLINLLTQEIQEQADLINALSKNLQDKANLVSQLTAENEIQAELISLMEQSFENQGIILSELRKEISDDAVIISQLTSSLDEQAIIINNLNYNLQEKAKLISELQKSNEDQAIIIDNLNLNLQEKSELISELYEKVEEQGKIIDLLKLNLVQKGELISNLKLSNENQAKLINELNLNLNEKSQLITELTDSLEEQGIIISNLKLNLDEKSQIIEDLTENVQEQAEIIKSMKLNLEEQVKLINLLKKQNEDLAMYVAVLQDSNEELQNLAKELSKNNEDMLKLIEEAEKVNAELQAKLRNKTIVQVVSIILLTGGVVSLFYKFKNTSKRRKRK